MCGRLSQYDGIHDFVATLSMPNPLVNKAGDHPFERYNAAPTTQLAIFHRRRIPARRHVSMGMAPALGQGPRCTN
jgi:putative SOS response-associated peptidase YedK